MYKTIALCIYILTINYSYFAKMLKYCTIICAWAGGPIFRNKLCILGTSHTLKRNADCLLPKKKQQTMVVWFEHVRSWKIKCYTKNCLPLTKMTICVALYCLCFRVQLLKRDLNQRYFLFYLWKKSSLPWMWLWSQDQCNMNKKVILLCWWN